MLREMIWYFGSKVKCYFCKKKLLTLPKGAQFGARDHSPVKERLALHHKNEDRELNDPKDVKPCHSTCHKRYHAKKRHKGKGLQKAE